MKLYHKYIIGKVALVLALSVVVCSSSLAVLNLVKLGKDRNLGIPPLVMLKLMVYYNAFLSIYSIPISMLIACLLVFGRLSSDHELTALRASGISPVRVFSSTISLSLVLSLGMLWLCGWAAPRSHAALMALRFDAFSLDAFFTPGRTIPLKNYSLHIGANDGGVLEDVTITVQSPDSRTTTVLAQWGTYIDRRSEGKVQLDLCDVEFFIEEKPTPVEVGATAPSPEDASSAGDGGAESEQQFVREKAKLYQVVFDFEDIKSRSGKMADKDDLTMRELLARRVVVGRAGDTALASAYAFEFNKRLVFALTPLVFAFVGVPLGVRVQRGERSLGSVVALFVAVAYYAAILGIERGIKASFIVPSVLVWVPWVGFVGLGVILMIRVNRGQ